jgi:tetratricopeptide (TPR) repeat protein
MFLHESTARTDVVRSDESSSDVETRALRADELPSASEASASQSMEALAAGATVGRYVVLDDLAHGGMSIVYVAHDPELDRRVALKVMRPDVSESPDKAQARLLREAMAMARLAHPNVVRVYDVGTLGERVYMAMELVEGITLRDWMTAEPRGWRAVVDVLVRAGRGLAAAHEAGLVHLDFKPRNVLVGKDGEVRVVDFGLARIGAGTDSSSSIDIEALPPATDAVTTVGMVMGTPGYMAPEQLDGSAPDARSDQFSFCVTAWEALYGVRPYPGQRLDAYRLALIDGRRLEPPARVHVPVRLRRLLERGLAIDSTRRHASLATLLDAMTHDPWRRWRRVGLAGAMAGIAALATWALVSAPEDPCAEQVGRLEDAWGTERREQVHARLAEGDLARHRPLADAIVEQVDGYAAAWVDAASEACRSARAEGRAADDASDVRGYCLEHRHRALRAATDLMLEPDDPGDTPWDRVVADLPPVEACRDVTSVYHVGRAPPGPEQRQHVEQADEQLARVWTLISAGRLADAAQAIDPVVRAAEATGHRPTLAHAKLVEATLHSMLDRAEEAERAGFEAVRLADAEGMHSVRLEAYAELVFTVGMLGGREREAENLGQLALWLESELVHQPGVRARVLSNLGANDTQVGRYERARDRFLEALELRRLQEGGDVDAAITMQGLGGAYLQLGQHEQALATFRQVREQVLARHGPRHPVTLTAWENEATALHALERYEEALAVLEQVRANIEGAGSDVPLDATLGAVLIELRRLSEAEVVLERVRVALEGSEVRPLLLGITYGNLALVDLDSGRAAQAKARIQQGLEVLGAQLGREHVYYAWLLGLQARAELELGEPLAALEHGAEGWRALVAADERGDRLVEPEHRAEAALAISQGLRDSEIAADPEAVARWGGGRMARAWAELAVREAERGGRSAEPVLERARGWLAELNG